MEQGEERADEERNAQRVAEGREKTIGDEGIQADLLQQAESHVAKEALGKENVTESVVRAADKSSGDGNGESARKKDGRGAFGGAPKIIGAPSERLRSVLVQSETNNQPKGKYNPRVFGGLLKLPDVPSNEGGEAKGFD